MQFPMGKCINNLLYANFASLTREFLRPHEGDGISYKGQGAPYSSLLHINAILGFAFA